MLFLEGVVTIERGTPIFEEDLFRVTHRTANSGLRVPNLLSLGLSITDFKGGA